MPDGDTHVPHERLRPGMSEPGPSTEGDEAGADDRARRVVVTFQVARVDGGSRLDAGITVEITPR